MLQCNDVTTGIRPIHATSPRPSTAIPDTLRHLRLCGWLLISLVAFGTIGFLIADQDHSLFHSFYLTLVVLTTVGTRVTGLTDDNSVAGVSLSGSFPYYGSRYTQVTIGSNGWVGFDNYTPLGRREFGGTAALPIWIDYMREALRERPEIQRPVPPGIANVKIDPDTGLLAKPGQRNAIFEYFLEETVPAQGVDGGGPGGEGQGTGELLKDIF